MTIFLADISSFEHGLSLADLADCAGILAKCSEGVYYADADYNGWRIQAARLGKLFVAYDFVRADEDPDDQAAWIAAHIVDPSLPLMLDVETEGTSKPTLPQVLALADRCRARGLRPKLAYIPRWYHAQIGSPDLTALWTRGIGLISSAYPGGSGTAAQLYPGDTAAGWLSYGGMAPMIYQFTDKASDGGQRIDMNAYRGSRGELAAFLGTAAPSSSPTPPGGDPVGTIPPSIGQKWPELAGDFPANATFTDETALIWADGGARAAALYALQARDAVNALAQRIGQPQPPAVDPAALAAALAPLLQGSVAPSPDDVASAVVAHLASQMAKG